MKVLFGKKNKIRDARDFSCYRKSNNKILVLIVCWLLPVFPPFFSLRMSGEFFFLTTTRNCIPTYVKTKAFKMAALANESRYHLLEWLSR